MSASYRFVDPLAEKELDELNAFLQQKKGELLSAAEAFLESHPHISVEDDLLDEIKRSPIFYQRDSVMDDMEIGVQTPQYFRFSYSYLNGIDSISALRQVQAEHPDWKIEDEYGKEFSLAEMEAIIRSCPLINVS